LAIPAFVDPYKLTNFISFSLVPTATTQPTDDFGVNAKVVAGMIPEPPSVVLLTLGMPLLLCVACLRRRRRAVASA
jgi:hypothetical protein